MATIKEVAKLAEVGTSTVSRYLNGSGYISEEATKRIKAACEQLDYTPNELARAMKLNHSKTIGVMIPTINNPFFTELIHVIEQDLLKNGYKTVLCNTNGDVVLEQNYLQMAMANCFDGIIMITGSYELLQRKWNIPMVLLDRTQGEDGVRVSLTSDNYQGAQLATNHLIACGCKKIAYLDCQEEIIPAKQRKQGFLDVIAAHQVDHVMVPMERMSAAYMKELKSRGVDGIFAWNDISAVKCLSYCIQAGIKVPEELQLVGYDNIELSQMVYPALTTVAQPLAKLGSLASLYLRGLIDGTVEPPITISLDNELVIRQSTRLC